jgi:hypothetical protein
MTTSALIAKAGEALVSAELARRGIYVAHPAYEMNDYLTATLPRSEFHSHHRHLRRAM